MEHEERVPITGPEVAETYGASFDGEPWIVMIELVEPLEETAFAAAIDPDIVHESSGRPTGLQLLLIDTPYGYVLRVSILLFDDPNAPFELRLPVNPAKDAAGPMLRKLAEQETTQIVFFHERCGEAIGRRVISIAPDTRAHLKEILDLASGRPSNLELWQQTVAAAERYL